jgi:sn-glycerol 3-phosphate transport system ATP-binding protein
MNLLPGRIAAPGLAEVNGGRIAFQAGAFKFDLGQEVDVGIRPEDLQFASSSGADRLGFLQDFTEELGATRLIHGNVGDAPLVVAVAASAPSDANGALVVDPAAVHLFDRDTGASLRRGSSV